MKNLVIYDSYYGNTEKIAQIIAQTIKADIIKVKEAHLDQLQGLNLLIIGSPTRAFRPSPAITGFINKLPRNSLSNIKVASFDTRVDLKKTNNKFLNFMVRIFGYAAKPIADQLVKKGGKLIAQPEGFLVSDSEGPLEKGEEDRAKKWAQKLIN